MQKSYKIEIGITPNYNENKYKPYYWVLFACSDSACCNECFGWAESPKKAWEEAYNFYLSFKQKSTFQK